jgi:hypothetical protein
MDPPHQLRSAAQKRDDITIAHREYDDGNVLVIDFGPSVETSVDVVGETAIVIAGDQQYEFDVPAEASEITTNDGILLIKE